ncbi:MAG: mechanosensitive ion channel [Planctomycetota bacterium]|nr:mechanosensitive ion channel [Planctomycetota bacterium]
MESLKELFSRVTENWDALALFVAGILAFYGLSRLLGAFTSRRLSQQSAALVSTGNLLHRTVPVGHAFLDELGYKLTALLGAAGIAGIAIGFAAQTSLSNIISGFFLLSERPFAQGDLVQCGSDTGFVLSVSLLSVKMRTFDNKLIRIPNENLIKKEVYNLTKFPIRRVNVKSWGRLQGERGQGQASSRTDRQRR